MFGLCRLPQSVAKDSERSELSRITFVFETHCQADCKLYFLAVRGNRNVVPHLILGWLLLTVPAWRSECVCVFHLRVIISGVTIWWINGMAARANSRTPTWSRATAQSPSPGISGAHQRTAGWDGNLTFVPLTSSIVSIILCFVPNFTLSAGPSIGISNIC